MRNFSVNVRTATATFKFDQTGQSSFAVAESASERFGGLCAVTVILAAA